MHWMNGQCSWQQSNEDLPTQGFHEDGVCCHFFSQSLPVIPWKSQHMMFLSGLRGAIAFGLSINNSATEGRRTLRTITHIIILVTVVISGGSTVNTLRWLKIPTGRYNNYSVYTIEYISKTEIFQHKFPMTMHLIL